METCVPNESNPFTTPAPSFILKPRAEKADPRTSLASPIFPLSSTTFGRGLRIRSSFDEDDGTASEKSIPIVEPEGIHSIGVTIDPPEWAVMASGEARLEPVGVTVSTHESIDLSSKACFKVGRSPSSDVRLMAPTSSRKHALIFHHPNGSCYIVDCCSAHGTYVNGVRVESPVPKGCSESCKVTAIPHRVKQGALIRFGGPGAPTFVLKSFSASLEGLVRELSGGKVGNCPLKNIFPSDGGSPSAKVSDKFSKGEVPSCRPTLAPTTPKPPAMTLEKGGMPCSPASALVALNTRVNALGGGALLSYRNRLIAFNAASKFVSAAEELNQVNSCLFGKRFRPEMLKFISEREYDLLSPCRELKRFRSSSFPISPEPSSRGCLKMQDITSHLIQTPLVSQQSLMSLDVEMSRIDSRRKVKFQQETHTFYPASVTPESFPGSFDEEHIACLNM